MRDNRSVVRVLAAVALLWFLALVVAPFLPAPASAALYLIGSSICHQRPDRSFWLDGLQLPVCARCLGIYGGAALGCAVAPFIPLGRRPRRTIVLATLPAVVSVGVEWAGLAHPSNTVRAITGVVGGAIIAAVVLATLNYEQCAPPRPIVPNRRPTPI